MQAGIVAGLIAIFLEARACERIDKEIRRHIEQEARELRDEIGRMP